MFPLIGHRTKLNDVPPANRFGARRRWDVHTGVDLFCPDGTMVFSIEDGIVTDIGKFTGASIGMPWWAETSYAAIEGKTGVFLYGELYENTALLKVGEEVREGDLIGHTKTVLLKDKGKPMCMLHLELYEVGYRGDWDVWSLEGEKPLDLRNPEEQLDWLT